MWSNAPEFYLGKETGNSNSWYSGNMLEPDVLTAPNTPWLMYTQVEIDPGQPTNNYGVNANTQADRIMLLTSSDCKNWTRKSDRGVITDIPDPAFQFSRDGFKWDSNENLLLEGSTDNTTIKILILVGSQL
jgi:hypothetical protein